MVSWGPAPGPLSRIPQRSGLWQASPRRARCSVAALTLLPAVTEAVRAEGKRRKVQSPALPAAASPHQVGSCSPTLPVCHMPHYRFTTRPFILPGLLLSPFILDAYKLSLLPSQIDIQVSSLPISPFRKQLAPFTFRVYNSLNPSRFGTCHFTLFRFAACPFPLQICDLPFYPSGCATCPITLPCSRLAALFFQSRALFPSQPCHVHLCPSRLTTCHSIILGFPLRLFKGRHMLLYPRAPLCSQAGFPATASR